MEVRIMSILDVKHLKKTYTGRFGGAQVEALKDVTFSVEDGEYVAIMGESGSGKTTLLNILATLDKATGGTVLLDGKDISTLRDNDLALFRRENLGFVFQEFNLLDTFSLRDNIYLPLVLDGKNINDIRELAKPITDAIGISDILDKFPYEVSGGQKQRVLLARALCSAKKLLILDDPMHGLDIVAKDELYSEIIKIYRDDGIAVMMIDHDALDGTVLHLSDTMLYCGPVENYVDSVAGKFYFAGRII